MAKNVSSVVFLTALYTHFLTSTVVNAKCCRVYSQNFGSAYVSVVFPSAESLFGPLLGRCGDCTDGTPHCGQGACNIFGCNCDGGCRTGRCDPDYVEPPSTTTEEPNRVFPLVDIDDEPIDIQATWADFQQRHILSGLLGSIPAPHTNWNSLMTARGLNHRSKNSFIRTTVPVLLDAFLPSNRTFVSHGTPYDIWETDSTFAVDYLKKSGSTWIVKRFYTAANIQAALNPQNQPVHFVRANGAPSTG